ncbi:MAG: tyrosine-type recombinase/integrase [Candidatus Gastranaerophilaceae bacterium]|nr:tyrosine-type recombinase/integrase [Candidatus Gastranaerophilaceae bacterium]
MKTVEPIRNKEKIAEVKTILEKESMRNLLLFVIPLNCGMRIGDVISLKVGKIKEAIENKALRLNEQKTTNNRLLPFNDTVIDLLKRYIKGMNDDDYLFPSRQAKGLQKKGDDAGTVTARKTPEHITRQQASVILTRAFAKAGLKNCNCHTPRKTFGYWHYKTYKDVAFLMQIFGHSAPSITLRYIGINDDIIMENLRTFEI